MDIATQTREKGIVGAGGAGFPTHIKMARPAEIVLVNAAECEPLLHKDKEILAKKTDLFLAGLSELMTSVEATKGIIGIKEKHHALIDHLKATVGPEVEVIPVRDFYPAGDEITLIYETTGRVVKAGELPLTEGVVVSNVETIYNIGKPGPVITKFLNITGDVAHRQTLEVPLGISFRELLAFAEPTIDNYAVLVGGPMMGVLATDLDEVVTKTTAALIVLPEDHLLIQRYRVMGSEKQVNKIGKSACDQCTFCTELCPRFLLGHPIQPHMAMRSLVFMDETGTNVAPEAHALYCCECNLCSFVSCPEGLYPGTVCVQNKRAAAAQKIAYTGPVSNQAHPLAEYRRTPSKRLKNMLDLAGYPDEGPLTDVTFKPSTLKLMLKQHIGAPASPLVSPGDRVTRGQKIATVGDALGSEIHAPEDGTVKTVTAAFIEITVGY